jgi:hypothetical protein
MAELAYLSCDEASEPAHPEDGFVTDHPFTVEDEVAAALGGAVAAYAEVETVVDSDHSDYGDDDELPTLNRALLRALHKVRS